MKYEINLSKELTAFKFKKEPYKSKAYLNIKKFLMPILGNLFAKLQKDNYYYKNKIPSFIEFEFVNILNDKKLKINEPAQVVSYIQKVLGLRINTHNFKVYLATNSSIKGLDSLVVRFKKALKEFHIKNKREPKLLSGSLDLKTISNIMGYDEEDILSIIPNTSLTEDSIFQETSEGTRLIDVIPNKQKNQEDEYIEKQKNEIIKNLCKTLPQQQQKILDMYYFNNVPLTKEEIAKEMGLPHHTIKNRIDLAKVTLKNNFGKILEDLR